MKLKILTNLFLMMALLGTTGFAADNPARDQLEVKIRHLDKLFGRLKFSGDLRLRWEGNETKPRRNVTMVDRVHWRNRYRYRLRMGVKAEINDEIQFVTRFASGNNSNHSTSPTSTNQTMTTNFVDKPFNVDRAYVRYRPRWVKDWFTLYLGKMKNPLYTTQMIWDSDVNPEGAAFKTDWKNVGGSKWSVYTNGAAYIFNEAAARNSDGWVAIAGAGLYGNIADVVDFKLGGNYYSWHKPEMNALTWTNSTTTGGNLVRLDGQLLSGYDVAEVRGDLNFKVLDHRVNLTGSYIANGSANADTTGKKWDDGIFGKVKFGRMSRKGKTKDTGDWWVSWMYYDLAPDATPAVFADADLRGTNTRSHEIELEYKFLPNTSIGGTVHLIEPHLRVNTFNGTELRDRNLYFIDMVTKF